MIIVASARLGLQLAKNGVAPDVSDLDSPVLFTTATHDRHRISELFGSFL